MNITFVANKSLSSNWTLKIDRVHNRVVFDLRWGENTPAHTAELTLEEFRELVDSLGFESATR